MSPHSGTLAWKIPWVEEPGGLQSMGSWRVGHDWATSLSLLTFLHWRRKWRPSPVLLPGASQGRGSLVGCLWGRLESITTWTGLKRLSSSSGILSDQCDWKFIDYIALREQVLALLIFSIDFSLSLALISSLNYVFLLFCFL